MVVPPPPGDAPPLARTIVRRTTDLIAIAFILIAGLTVAQRLLVWWKTDPSETLADPEALFSRDALAPWGAGPEGVAIDLGEKPLTLQRQVFAGTLAEAQIELRRNLRQTLTGEVPPLPPLTAEESRLAETLRQRTAADAAPDQAWSLYDWPGPPTMAFGLRRGDPPDQPDRVVCWGLVLPLDAGAWSILSITPRSSTVSAERIAPLSLPVGVRPGLSLRDEFGGQLVTFTGDGPPDAWRRHFDELAQARGWTTEVEWQVEPQAVSAVWSTTNGQGDSRIDLRLTSAEAGWTGLINVTPIRQKVQP